MIYIKKNWEAECKEILSALYRVYGELFFIKGVWQLLWKFVNSASSLIDVWKEFDQCQYLNNCAPTPPLTQH